ncbi:hypothetical protein OH492_00860 [Vibrio chagasii]|nr:hypothetical protein [Vibrio chagasii]
MKTRGKSGSILLVLSVAPFHGRQSSQSIADQYPAVLEGAVVMAGGST